MKPNSKKKKEKKISATGKIRAELEASTRCQSIKFISNAASIHFTVDSP